MGEDLGSMLERDFGVSDIAKSKKISGIFFGYKRFTKIKLQTLPNHFNFNKTLSIKHFPLRRLTCWFNKGEVNGTVNKSMVFQ